MTTSTTARPENEFDGLPPGARAQRRWFTAPVGGHVSAVIWGSGTPAFVIVPDDGVPARTLDPLALALDRPVVVIDRLGTGRSSGPAPSTPAREARPLAEAAWSFAPQTPTLVGLGTGGAAAALTAAGRARAITRVVLVGAAAPADPPAGITVVPLPDTDPTDPPAVAQALATL
jgi:pimeloyl-ACP methyl ester carboxylesterase